MKKVFTMAAIALFMMTSCSDDDSSSNNNNNTDTVLLKKTIEVIDGETITTNYLYNGNKLTKRQASDGSYTNFTYTGDLLTSSATYDAGSDENVTDTYEYNSNNTLKSHTIRWQDDDPDYIQKYDYTYNTNGTITMAAYYGDAGLELEPYDTYTITMSNGNITSVNGLGGNNTYTFDTKNSPFKNVTGYNVLVLGDYEGGLNNALTYNSTEFDESSTTAYVYNSSNYPTTSTQTLSYDGGEDVTVTQYFYE